MLQTWALSEIILTSNNAMQGGKQNEHTNQKHHIRNGNGFSCCCFFPSCWTCGRAYANIALCSIERVLIMCNCEQFRADGLYCCNIRIRKWEPSVRDIVMGKHGRAINLVNRFLYPEKSHKNFMLGESTIYSFAKLMGIKS